MRAGWSACPRLGPAQESGAGLYFVMSQRVFVSTPPLETWGIVRGRRYTLLVEDPLRRTGVPPPRPTARGPRAWRTDARLIGRQAKTVARLRRFIPPRMYEQGVRRTFSLDGAS